MKETTTKQLLIEFLTVLFFAAVYGGAIFVLIYISGFRFPGDGVVSIIIAFVVMLFVRRTEPEDQQT